MRRASIAIGGLLFASLVAPALVAYGQGPVPKLVPYRGYLESNGAAVDGSVNLRFTLFAEATGGTAVWQGSFDDVPVVGGRFSVALGEAPDPLPDMVFDSPELYLGVEVRQTEPDWVQLAGRQRVLSVGYAVRADNAMRANADFSVPGSLTVDGDANVAGDTTVSGNTSVGGDTNVVGLVDAGSTNVAGLVDAGSMHVRGNVTGAATIAGLEGATLPIESNLSVAAQLKVGDTVIRGMRGTGPHGVISTSCPSGWGGRCSGPLVHENSGICFMAQDDGGVQCRVVKDTSGYWRAHGANAGADHQCQASCIEWDW